MASDHRDLIIKTLAHSEAELLDEIVELTTACDAYRVLACEAIHRLHALVRQHDQLRMLHHRLIDEVRRLRLQILREAEAA
jgi:hypothetical protein